MAKDRYKYFRIEARELLEGLNQGVLDLEKGDCTSDRVGHILRLVHTLKGASRVVKQPEIARFAHAIEDAFAPFRAGQDVVPREHVNQVLALLDKIAMRVLSLEPASAEAERESPRPVSEEFETVRVEVEEIDRLLNSVSEASVRLGALRQESRTVARACQLAGTLFDSLAQRPIAAGLTDTNTKARALAEQLRTYLKDLDRSLVAEIDQVEAEFARVRDATNHLRLLPAVSVFASLQRAVRDAAESLEKDVVFESSGGNIRLDAHVLLTLRDALLHVVRNAVAHGIETSPERRAAGKPLQGRVELRVERRGNRVVFICRDDGRGINVEAVRLAAVHRGLAAPSEANSLGLQEAVRLIMKGGLTTTGAVDEVSGRGIGLDVVRDTTVRLRGEVTIHSEVGIGTSLEICVPVSVSSLTALEVDTDGTITFLPLYAVRQTLRIADRDIVRSAENESIVQEQKVIPFLGLATALRKKTATTRARQSWSAVVVEVSGGMAAIGVDRVLGATSIIVRPLPVLAQAEPTIAGCSLDAEGNARLVLDPAGLVAAACRGGTFVHEMAAPTFPSVLVIDDSLTTRMLEQNILESAGYEVDLATSGEEALERARKKQYGLFLVDVEMPGMDGFEFVSRTQADTLLRAVPSILVTSRSAAEDRRRGEQVGARAYILKGEFDQGHLLQMIGECIG
jgi:two-component system chemotaxis sensor kinase CheA